MIIKIPGKTKQGQRTAKLVTLADDWLRRAKGSSQLAARRVNNGSMNRNYVVSESWSQAAVITKRFKLGMMIDPTVVHNNWDSRSFGDMFFDMEKNPLEIDNRISDIKLQKEIEKLKGYYNEFLIYTPAIGKDELVNQRMDHAITP